MDKGKRQRKKDNTGKRKRGVGIGIKIMGLLLLLAITAISCVGVLVWTLQSVIGMSDQIVSEQVAEQEKISTLSRQFTYINSQVLTHVMTTNSVTMDTLSEKILQDIADMEQQIEEFGALLSEGDERKEAQCFCRTGKIQKDGGESAGHQCREQNPGICICHIQPSDV